MNAEGDNITTTYSSNYRGLTLDERKEMMRSDAKRTEIPREFVYLLDDGCSFEGWLSKLNFSKTP